MSEESGNNTVDPAVVFKRIEQVRSELLEKLEKMAKSMNDNFRDFLPRIHESNIQALLANRNSVTTRHFLYDKKLIDKKEFIDFSDNNDFVRTFNREIEVLQALINDIAVVDNKNYVELDFLKEKNRIRTLEIWQAQIDRIKLNIADLESINLDENKIKPLREHLKMVEDATKKEFEELTQKKTPQKEYYLKKKEGEEAVSKFLDDKRNEIVERLRILPPTDIKTHLEPYVWELLSEAKVLYCLECYNSCIISCCVAIEAVLKDVVRIKEGEKDVELDFSDLIALCLKKGFIDEQESKFLEGVKDQYRNPYVHANLSKIIPKVVMKGVELRGSKVSDLKLITETDAPVLRQIVKKRKDQESGYSLFGETIKFMKRISGKHFNYSGAEKKNDGS